MNVLNTYKYQLAILFTIIIGCFLFFQVVMDDAYIYFRYGYNLINHGVWNFFPSKENLTESYTSFIYSVLSILPAAIHTNPYIIFKIVGLFFFISIIVKLYNSTKNRAIALIAILVFTSNWETYVHTFSGLETMLWFWLFLHLIFLLDLEINNKKQHLIWLICLLLPLTRPEGILISISAFLYLKFLKKIKINYLSLLICISIGCLYFMVRFSYFELLFPLPFYQKSVKNNAGILNVIINTITSIHYLVCIVFFIIISRSNSFLKRLSMFVLILFFVAYSTSLLSMNFADRFSYQLFFPVILFGIISSSNMNIMQQLKIKYISIFLVIFIFAKGFYASHPKDLSSMGDNMFSSYYYTRTHYNLASKFRTLNNDKIKVFFNEAGIFPYYANVEYYDPEGLTNKYLSKNVLTKEYIETTNPDVFLYLVREPKEDIATWINNLPANHPLFYYKYLQESDKYENIGYVTCIEQHAYVGIAVSKNSTYYKQISDLGNVAITESEQNKFSIKRFLKFKYFNTLPTI